VSARTFLVFRHGETDYNRHGRVQGWTDVPLNPDGQAQAATLAPLLAAHDVRSIVTSDLTRAHQTAVAAAGGRAVVLHRDMALREIFYGELEGLLFDDLVVQLGQEFMARWRHLDAAGLEQRIPSGESKREALTRAHDAIRRHAARVAASETFAVSTHGGIIRCLIGAAEGGAAAPQKIRNCGAFRMRWDPTRDAFTYLGELTPCP
jgi:probable phosphoglycerate mutase